MKHDKKTKAKSTSPAQKPAVAVASKPMWQPANPLLFSLLVTGVFFIVVLFGMLHHEMWRDELQAWLVAKDAHSIGQLFGNLKYDGHPAFWHFLLYIITCFTHNPVYMQVLHLLLACGFIYVFNRYATIGWVYKIMFSFGYLTAYEYSVISRCYALTLLLLFIFCALYKYRSSRYITIGIVLALLANSNVYGVLMALGGTGILFLDFFFNKQKEKKNVSRFSMALGIAVIGIVFSVYQIMPTKDNSFPVYHQSGLFVMEKWSEYFSHIFTSYFYIPQTKGINFWNSHIYFENGPITTVPFGAWLHAHREYLWSWCYMPTLILLLSLIIFIRKPLILTLYVGLTFALLAFYYYTGMSFVRYCGFLFITLVICYWLAGYYEERNYKNKILIFFSNFGRRIQMPFLAITLGVNIIGACVAYSKDYHYTFSTTKQAADYIRENKMDTLTIAGIPDYTISSISAYLDKQIYYPQMKDYGSFCIWINKRTNDVPLNETFKSVINLINEGHKKVLLVKTSIPKLNGSDGSVLNLEKVLIAEGITMELIQKFEGAIEDQENCYIYMIQKHDTKAEDLSQYIRLY